MKIDSGAGISVENFKNCTLKDTTVKLRCCEGSILRPEGEFFAAKYKNENFENCRFLIVKNGSVPLMGRGLIKLLNIKIDFSEDTNNLNVVQQVSIKDL